MIAQIFDANEVDLSCHVAALRRAFHETPWARQIGVTLTEEFYRWKYDAPAGQAKIAYVMSGEQPVSGVSAFPMTFELPNHELKRGWQIGDIMTVPEMRRCGLYGKCLSAIIEQLDNDLLICFPNDQSLGSIKQLGFMPVADVETFVRPIMFPVVGRGLADVSELGFSDIPSPPSTAFQSSSVHKDQEYLRWRYARHPVFRYQALGGSEGLAVTRAFRLFGVNVAIVMEFHPTEGSWSLLLKKVHNWARGNGMVASFLMANWLPVKPIRSGYLFVPSAMLPKRQVLYVRYPQGRTVHLHWKTQIGDWDGL